MSDRVLILAAHLRHAIEAARELGLGQTEWSYLDSAHRLNGRTGYRFHAYETAWLHPDYVEITTRLRMDESLGLATRVHRP